MRNIDQLAAVGAASAALFAGAAQPAMANCDPHARQQFIENQVISDKSFNSPALKPHHPETTSIVAREVDQPGNIIINPGAITCRKHIIDYFGLKVELSGSTTEIGIALLPAANAEVSRLVGNHATPVKDPERAGLLVRRTLHAQFDDVYGPIGFTDGNLTFGLMP